MDTHQFSRCLQLKAIFLDPETEVHGVEVDGEQRGIAPGQWVEGDAGGLGGAQPGLRCE